MARLELDSKTELGMTGQDLVDRVRRIHEARIRWADGLETALVLEVGTDATAVEQHSHPARADCPCRLTLPIQATFSAADGRIQHSWDGVVEVGPGSDSGLLVATSIELPRSDVGEDLPMPDWASCVRVDVEFEEKRTTGSVLAVETEERPEVPGVGTPTLRADVVGEW